jgi:isoleucyl-tRNA synthetase
MRISSMGRSARSKAGIKVRQPLARALVKVRSKSEQESVGRVKPQVAEELNVKDIVCVEDTATYTEPGFESNEDGGYWVAIDKTITPDLADEGLVREVVHRIQNMRKDAGFEIADYITTYYERNALLDRVLKNAVLVGYIKQETLSHAIVEGIPAEAYKEAHKIEGQEITLGVKR